MTRRNLFHSLLAAAATLVLATGALAANWHWTPWYYGVGAWGEPSGIQFMVGEHTSGNQNKIKFRNKNNQPVSVHCTVDILRPYGGGVDTVAVFVPKLKKNKISGVFLLGPGEVQNVEIYRGPPL